MADRSLSVRLQAEISQYLSGMQRATLATRGLADSIDTTQARTRSALAEVGQGATLIGGVMVAGFAAAIMAAADFDKSMSGVQAATMASAGTMDALRQSALEAGADTSYSATEAADAITEMAKAGVSAGDIMGGGLTGALNLAAAGQLEVADAAEIAATALSVFGLQGSQMPHVADLLAAGAGKAQGSVADLSAALNQSALVAKNTGLSIEDTTGALALFASKGLLGSDAGTSFKTMLMSLNPRSDEAAQLMDTLGLRAYDASGEFVGMAGYADQLQTALGGMSSEQRNATLQTIFGSDAVRAATVLYQAGGEGIRKWTGQVDDAGFAARQAAMLTDNLAGDVERLGGALDTALIQGGSGANDVLRFLTQTATGAVNTFGELPGPLQATATGFLGIVGGGTLALGLIGTMIPRIVEARIALASLGPAGEAANRGIGALGRAGAVGAALAVGIGVLSAAYDAMHPPIEIARQDTEQLTRRLMEMGTAAGGAAADLAAIDAGRVVEQMQQVQPHIFSVSQDLGALGKAATMARFDFVDAAGQIDAAATASFEAARQAVEDTDAALAGMVSGGNADRAASAAQRLLTAWTESGGELGEFRARFPQTIAAMEQYSQTADTVVTDTGAITDGLGEAKSASDFLRDSFDALNGVALTAAEANIRWTQAMADFTVQAENGSTSLDLNTAAGAANADQFVQAATTARDFAAAVGDTSGPEAGRAKLEELRTALINNAEATGFNRGEVTTLIDELFRVPPSVETAATLVDSASPGLTAVNQFLDRTDGRVATTYVNTVVTQTLNTILKATPYTEVGSGGNLPGLPAIPRRAAGGRVWAGQPFWVGEDGPELVQFGADAFVTPTALSRAAAAGASTAGAVQPQVIIPQPIAPREMGWLPGMVTNNAPTTNNKTTNINVSTSHDPQEIARVLKMEMWAADFLAMGARTR